MGAAFRFFHRDEERMGSSLDIVANEASGLRIIIVSRLATGS